MISVPLFTSIIARIEDSYKCKSVLLTEIDSSVYHGYKTKKGEDVDGSIKD